MSRRRDTGSAGGGLGVVVIFEPAVVRAILRGEVTQHRRPVRGSDPYYRENKRIKSARRSRTLVKPYRPTVGDRFPVQQKVRRDGKETVETHGHAILTSVCTDVMGALSFEDARQMGYRTTSAAMAGWMAAHDRHWPDAADSCQCCGGPGLAAGFCVTCGCDDQARARFARRHANRTVYVLRFEVDGSHVPRLLAARPSTETGDYVTNSSMALNGPADAGEALTVTDHERHVAANSALTHEQWLAVEHAARDAELERLSLGRRLDLAIKEAQAAGRSISREVNVIEKRLRALEQGVRHVA